MLNLHKMTNRTKHFTDNGETAVFLSSENGTVYQLSVDNSGALVVTNRGTGEQTDAVPVIGGSGGVLYITAELGRSDEGSDTPDTVLNPSHTYENVKAAVDAGIQCVLKARADDDIIHHMPLAGESYGEALPGVYIFTLAFSVMPMAVMVTENGWSVMN